MTATSGGAPPAAGEPGWFPDPWGTEKLRWWDGDAWTPHLYPPAEPAPAAATTTTTPAGVGPAAVAPERTAARWARISLLWAGPLQALYDVGLAVQAGWYADHFDEMAKGHTPQLTGAAGASAACL